jgi:uncharacterized protein (TIGR02594 family)
MKEAGYKTTDSKAAKSWLLYGEKLSIPITGCIVVFKRPHGHHVGFYISSTKNSVQVLGGNQDDSVKIKRYSYPVLGYRWPIK